ncbi:hypothetical protein IscW_ISCW024932 [Ixodes scapularis]|uniref:Uncharacterized protein n=1 Tax=Ixodes scapularis TaxID=6945 RepID=B7QNF7_IXOSC|nr:hypothetical protein IscW_ISCW024932 [Ixodes scapularis]|eukprot:XP_002416462.1 hypothetical protein IscW_ISCW024932 [Ixodes scapularis]
MCNLAYCGCDLSGKMLEANAARLQQLQYRKKHTLEYEVDSFGNKKECMSAILQSLWRTTMDDCTYQQLRSRKRLD